MYITRDKICTRIFFTVLVIPYIRIAFPAVMVKSCLKVEITVNNCKFLGKGTLLSKVFTT